MATLNRELPNQGQGFIVPPEKGKHNTIPEGGSLGTAFDDPTLAERAAARGEITQLLAAWGQGDQQALDKVFPLAFTDLRLMARKWCGKIACKDLQPTELISEIYDTFLQQRKVTLECRGQFFRFAALLMQRTLLDHKRQLLTQRRGGDQVRVPIEAIDCSVNHHSATSPTQPVFANTPDTIGTAIDIAEKIAELAKLDPKQAETARLRCFVGLTVKETAEVLDVSIMTVNRKWHNAKRFLALQLHEYAPE